MHRALVIARLVVQIQPPLERVQILRVFPRDPLVHRGRAVVEEPLDHEAAVGAGLFLAEGVFAVQERVGARTILDEGRHPQVGDLHAADP